MNRQVLRHLLLTIILCIFFAEINAAKKTPSYIEEALVNLDKALDRYEFRLDSALNNMESLKIRLSAANSDSVKLELYRNIIRGYSHRNVDSVIDFSQKAYIFAQAIGDEDAALSFRINSIPVLPLKGYIHEAIVKIDSIEALEMSPEMRLQFVKVATLTYKRILSIYSSMRIFEKYYDRFIAYNDSVLKYGSETSPDYNMYLGTRYIGDKKIGLALEALSDHLDSVDPISNEYVETQGLISMLSFERGRYEDWLYRLIRSAEVEAYLGNIDSENLRLIASKIYDYGDIDRAHRYVLLSHWFVMRSGAAQRGVHIASTMPRIVDSYIHETRKAVYAMWGLIVCVVLIVILIIVILRNKSRDLQRMKELGAQIANANSVKEAYIGQFMSLCSDYIERLEDYNKLIARKLLAGQADDVLNTVKSGKFVESQLSLFYDIFDNAFMHIYPSFVSDVNSLLVDDKTFKVGDGDKLTPELRILAFMRLGIDDSAKMARFLRLSLNTVYTYRNRMRSKAKDRNTFERDIAKIGSFHTSD